MSRTRWFDRTFGDGLEIGAFPSVVERLRGTPARVDEKASELPEAVLVERLGDTWSIQENIGHLLDLEPLWQGRLDDFLGGQEVLRPADLTNQKTNEARHNESSVGTLTATFRSARLAFVERLDHLSESDIRRTARHPRLETTMRLIDLAYFVAEHDDHHLARITELTAALGR